MFERKISKNIVALQIFNFPGLIKNPVISLYRKMFKRLLKSQKN